MNTSNSFKVSIPRPCHEDWNKMTQNEQGSFCSKCCKTVIDFTNKSMKEIKNILVEAGAKKVCGRFRRDQLNEGPKPIFDFNIPLYKLPKNLSYKKAFAVALLLVFSSTLFSCGREQGEAVGRQAGDTTTAAQRVDTSGMEITDSTKKTTEIMGDSVIQQQPVMGGAKYEPIKGEAVIQSTQRKKQKGDIPKKAIDTAKTKVKEIKVYVGHDPG